MNLRLAWFTNQVQQQPRLHRETIAGVWGYGEEDVVSLCCPEWPRTHSSTPASAFQVSAWMAGLCYCTWLSLCVYSISLTPSLPQPLVPPCEHQGASLCGSHGWSVPGQRHSLIVPELLTS